MLMYVSFPWLSIIFLRVTHLLYMSLLSLFLAAWGIFHCRNIFSSLILLLMNNLSSLQFLTIMNKVAMSILIKDFCYCFHFSRVNVWELKYWSLGMCQFKFWETARFFSPKWLLALLFIWEFQFLYILTIFEVVNFSHFGGCVLVFSRDIVCSSLVSNEV